MNVVELKDVKKFYMLGQTRVDALRGVSLSIGQGEFLAHSRTLGFGKKHHAQHVRLHRHPFRRDGADRWNRDGAHER